jgi:hypothetical protein
MFFFLCLGGFSLLFVIADSKSIAFENSQIGKFGNDANDEGMDHFQVNIKIWALCKIRRRIRTKRNMGGGIC